MEGQNEKSVIHLRHRKQTATCARSKLHQVPTSSAPHAVGKWQWPVKLAESKLQWMLQANCMIHLIRTGTCSPEGVPHSPLSSTLSLPSRHATARNEPLGDTAMDATPPQPGGSDWSVAPWSSITQMVSSTATNTFSSMPTIHPGTAYPACQTHMPGDHKQGSPTAATSAHPQGHNNG